MSLVDALSQKHGLPVLDRAGLEMFLAPTPSEPAHALLFFAGDPVQHREATDVAVVLPEILAAFRGRLRAGVIDAAVGKSFERRFHVAVLPSLVMVRGADTLGVLPRICDWADYVARITAWLDPATPVMAPSVGPRTEIVTKDRTSA